MGGSTYGSSPRARKVEIAWSWIGAFVDIGATEWLSPALFAVMDLWVTRPARLLPLAGKPTH